LIVCALELNGTKIVGSTTFFVDVLGASPATLALNASALA
jgi:hypothetical protein